MTEPERAPRTIDVTAVDFVSVILPTYNRAHTLNRAMRSVLAQTHENLELIIADDGSTDETEALVRAVNDDRIVYVRQDPNRGASSARNLGLSQARGKLIAFHDSDDEWLLDKLALQVSTLQRSGPEIGATYGIKIIYGQDEKFRSGGRRTSMAPHPGSPVVSGDITSALLRRNLISPQTLLLKADLAKRIGGFDERLPCNNDWDFMIRLSELSRVEFTPVPVVVAYVSDDSIHTRMHSKALSFLVILRKHRKLFESRPRIHAEKMFEAARHLHRLRRYRAASCCMTRAIRIAPAFMKPWAGLVQVHFLRLASLLARRRPAGSGVTMAR